MDDDIFMNGIYKYFPNELLPKWNERSNKLCWRGGCSGMLGEDQSKWHRLNFVKSLFNRADASNVRLTNGWSDGKNIPSCYFGESMDYTEFLNHKIFFAVNGNTLPSSLMYAFASGCVPFLFPKYEFWFQSYIIPNVHYIPVKWDLSDLHEKIDWVKNNDKEAEQISINAREFAITHFTPEFQRKYLKDTIDRYCRK